MRGVAHRPLAARGASHSSAARAARCAAAAVSARPAARAPRRACVTVRAAGSTYGNAFRVTTFGESHGKGVGCVVDGVPPRLALSTEEIQVELDRRRPGQSIITTPRKEEDACEILSGVADGVTLGTPIAVLVRNKDQRSGDYSEMEVAYRPSHADATYDFKYGIRAIAGGGRSSARETIGRVAAGAIAKKLLKEVAGTEVRRALRCGCPTAAAGCAPQRGLTGQPGSLAALAARRPMAAAVPPSGRAAAAQPHAAVRPTLPRQVLAYVSRVRDIGCSVDEGSFTMADVESNIVRCPDQAAAQKMIDGGHARARKRPAAARAPAPAPHTRCTGAPRLCVRTQQQPAPRLQGWPDGLCRRMGAAGACASAFHTGCTASTVTPASCAPPPAMSRLPSAINEVRNRGDSCGGEVTCVVRSCPKGLGSPVFDKLEAELAKVLMSLPATKGFEIGSGFAGSAALGSEHNDEFYIDERGAVRTRTNRSGGVQGGISNGEHIVMRVAFKPTSTISRLQSTVTREGRETELRARGRHDPCVVPRAVPMVESMVALVLADQLLQHFAQCELLPRADTASPDKTLGHQFATGAAAAPAAAASAAQ